MLKLVRAPVSFSRFSWLTVSRPQAIQIGLLDRGSFIMQNSPDRPVVLENLEIVNDSEGVDVPWWRRTLNRRVLATGCITRDDFVAWASSEGALPPTSEETARTRWQRALDDAMYGDVTRARGADALDARLVVEISIRCKRRARSCPGRH